MLRVALVATVERMPLAGVVWVLRAHQIRRLRLQLRHLRARSTVTASATLAEVAEAQVAEVACSRLAAAAEAGWLEAMKDDSQAAREGRSPLLEALTEAGAIEVVVEAMNAHSQAMDVHVHGCRALNGLCDGRNAVAAARTQRAVKKALGQPHSNRILRMNPS